MFKPEKLNEMKRKLKWNPSFIELFYCHKHFAVQNKQ